MTATTSRAASTATTTPATIRPRYVTIIFALLRYALPGKAPYLDTRPTAASCSSGPASGRQGEERQGEGQAPSWEIRLLMGPPGRLAGVPVIGYATSPARPIS